MCPFPFLHLLQKWCHESIRNRRFWVDFDGILGCYGRIFDGFCEGQIANFGDFLTHIRGLANQKRAERRVSCITKGSSPDPEGHGDETLLAGEIKGSTLV